ncbi:hypothetical protein B484DRAFT_479452 [Ochromonadaceae sp. CCMP2298]|nr:hypothetical protein B484DRAFT_479452 [Ochromonadaceae sp. CCMP2298]
MGGAEGCISKHPSGPEWTAAAARMIEGDAQHTSITAAACSQESASSEVGLLAAILECDAVPPEALPAGERERQRAASVRRAGERGADLLYLSSLALDDSVIAPYEPPEEGMGSGAEVPGTHSLAGMFSPTIHSRPLAPRRSQESPLQRRRCTTGSRSLDSNQEEGRDEVSDLCSDVERSLHVSSGEEVSQEGWGQAVAAARIQVLESLLLEKTAAEISDLHAQLAEARSPSSQLAAVILSIQVEACELVQAKGPFHLKDKSDFKSYLDLKMDARIEQLQGRSLWRLLMEGVLGRDPGGTPVGDVAARAGGVRYPLEYYTRGIFSTLSVLFKLRHKAALRSGLTAWHFNAALVAERMENKGWLHAHGTLDNVNMQVQVLEQRSDWNSKMVNVTLGYIMPALCDDPALPKHVRQVPLAEDFPLAALVPGPSDHRVLRRFAEREIRSCLIEQWPAMFGDCGPLALSSDLERAADTESLPPAVGSSRLNFPDRSGRVQPTIPAMLPLMPHNEAQTAGMIHILGDFRAVAAHADSQGHTRDNFFLTGDLLTVMRIRGAKDVQSLGEESASHSIRDMQYMHCLIGYFHHRWTHQSCLIGEHWGLDDGEVSGRDGGSLAWFKRALGKRKLVKKDGKEFYACQEFLGHCSRAYFVGAATVAMQRRLPAWSPASVVTDIERSAAGFPTAEELLTYLQQQVLAELYDPIQHGEYVNAFSDPTAFRRSDNSLRSLVVSIMVASYARAAVRREDGPAMLRYCRFSLPRFLGCGSKHYSSETCRETVHIFGLFSAGESHIAVHDRFDRESDRSNHWVEKDLLCEHIVGEVKGPCKRNPNLSEDLIAQKTATAGVYRFFVKNLLSEFGCAVGGTAHSTRSDLCDVAQAAAQLVASGIFDPTGPVAAALWGPRKDVLSRGAQRLAQGLCSKIVQAEYALAGGVNGESDDADADALDENGDRVLLTEDEERSVVENRVKEPEDD